jgi:hypothetical protein
MPDLLRIKIGFVPRIIILNLFLLFFGNCFSLLALEEDVPDDTLIIDAEQEVLVADTLSRDPRKATLYAAVLPGPR